MTEQQSEWSEWFEHDGKGCPCVGMLVNGVFEDGDEFIMVVGSVGGEKSKFGDDLLSDLGSWTWVEPYVRFVKYRIRRPRALLDLIQMVADLPAPTTTPAPGVIA